MHGALTVGVKEQDLQGVAQIVMIHLLRAQAMQADRGLGSNQKVEDAAQRPAAIVAGWQRGGRNLKHALVGFTREATGRMRLQVKKTHDLVR
jgi:hypothetical protein